MRVEMGVDLFKTLGISFQEINQKFEQIPFSELKTYSKVFDYLSKMNDQTLVKIMLAFIFGARDCQLKKKNGSKEGAFLNQAVDLATTGLVMAIMAHSLTLPDAIRIIAESFDEHKQEGKLEFFIHLSYLLAYRLLEFEVIAIFSIEKDVADKLIGGINTDPNLN